MIIYNEVADIFCIVAEFYKHFDKNTKTSFQGCLLDLDLLFPIGK